MASVVTSAVVGSVFVRPALARDRAMWEVMFDSYREAAGLTPDREISDRLWGWILDPNHQVQALVADDGLALVGFAHYRRFPRPIMADECLYLDDLFTTVQARGRGVARALLDHLVELRDLESMAMLRWTTNPSNAAARKLYGTYGSIANSVTYNAALPNAPSPNAT